MEWLVENRKIHGAVGSVVFSTLPRFQPENRRVSRDYEGLIWEIYELPEAAMWAGVAHHIHFSKKMAITIVVYNKEIHFEAHGQTVQVVVVRKDCLRHV